MSIFGRVFGGFKSSLPRQVAAPVAPARDDPAVQREAQEARRKQRLVALLRAGRRATILTSGQGVLNDPATTVRKQLLGA